MRFPSTICYGMVLALAASCVCAETASVNPAVGSRLRTLATAAKDRTFWEALRRFAESARSSEEKGLAFFALGYREYDSGQFEPALEDLRRAAGINFSLRDYAEYYRAVAARQADQPNEVRAALEGFSARHPQSALRLEAGKLLATALLEVGQARQVIEILTAEPRVRQRPALALLLARAYLGAGRPVTATAAFQDIYYAYPTAPEAEPAKRELDQLVTELGENFPLVPIEIQTARAEIFQRRRRYPEALREYGLLLQANSESPDAGRWKVGQARAMIGLRRTSQALEVLKTRFSDDRESDAWRLALLVEVYRRRGDTPGVIRATGEIGEVHPDSSAYAAALDEAGNFFVREGDWTKASLYYRKLAESFPHADLAPEASWRVAWANYLEGDYGGAREALAEHLRRYPNSSRIPSVLYWLGRLAEERGALSEARFLYELIKDRFGNNYYTIRAEARLKNPRLRGTPKIAQQDSPIAALAARIPLPVPPPLQPCATHTESRLLRPFETLRDLGLDDLAERYLRLVLAENPGEPEAAVALGRALARQGGVDVGLFTVQRAVPGYPDYEFSRLPREVWDLLYPRNYKNLVAQQARAHGLDPNLVLGIIRQESAFNPRATSPANARGLMQVLPRTVSRTRARQRTAARRLYEPAYNLRIGCAYLRGRLKTFDDKIEQALAAYHAGPSRVKQWTEGRDFSEPAEFLETIPIPSTRAYVERVLRDAAIYRQLITGTAEFAECGSPLGR